MAEVLLKIEELTKSFGGLVAIQQLSMEVEAGEIHAVIGPNGAGKTTLIAQLSGSLKPDSGRILFENREITHVPEYRRSALAGSVLPDHKRPQKFFRLGQCGPCGSGPRRTLVPFLE